MTESDAKLRARNLRTLAALAGLFLLPLVLAFLSYYGNFWRPGSQVNHGLLITPPRPLPALALRRVSPEPAQPFHGKWSLVYVSAGACEEACRRALYLMRQTRLALNNDMTRVERVLLAGGECAHCAQLSQDFPGLTVLAADDAPGAAVMHEFPEAQRGHSLFVVDPLGNLMMSYDARQDPHGLLEDLKKLLRLSHIG